MDETSVNNLNGIPNFGHGLPEDGVVQAGITDVATPDTPVEEPVTETEQGDVVPEVSSRKRGAAN